LAHVRQGERAVDTSGRSSSAGFGWDDQRDGDGRGDSVVGQWPDGTAITDAETRAPNDLRDLIPEQRRFQREERWARRHRVLTQIGRVVGSPRSAIAVVLLAALIASAVAMVLPIAR
jgi:hypothetical protein